MKVVHVKQGNTFIQGDRCLKSWEFKILLNNLHSFNGQTKITENWIVRDWMNRKGEI